MSVPQIARLITSQIPSTEASLYQVPANTDVSITQIMMCNTHSGAVTVNIALTDTSATSSSAADRFFNSFSLNANETAMVMTNLPVFTGEQIWANASVNNVVNLIVSGVTTDTSV